MSRARWNRMQVGLSWMRSGRHPPMPLRLTRMPVGPGLRLDTMTALCPCLRQRFFSQRSSSLEITCPVCQILDCRDRCQSSFEMPRLGAFFRGEPIQRKGCAKQFVQIEQGTLNERGMQVVMDLLRQQQLRPNQRPSRQQSHHPRLTTSISQSDRIRFPGTPPADDRMFRSGRASQILEDGVDFRYQIAYYHDFSEGINGFAWWQRIVTFASGRDFAWCSLCSVQPAHVPTTEQDIRKPLLRLHHVRQDRMPIHLAHGRGL